MKQGLSFCLLILLPMLSHAQEVILRIDSSNIDSVRKEISHAIYGNEAIPAFEPLPVPAGKSIKPFMYPTKNIGSIEIGIVKMKHGFTSKIYIIHPAKDNGLNVPVIYHSGHGFGVFREDLMVNFDGDTVVGRLTIDHFLSKGFTVVGIAMPFFGENTWPAQVTENNIVHPMQGHNDVFYLDNPFYYFMAPAGDTFNCIVSFSQIVFDGREEVNEYVSFSFSFIMSAII